MVNTLLADRMEDAGMTQQELADALNRRIDGFTGRPGSLTDRHIRNWLKGTTTWPQAKQRRALEEEFGCSAQELGFAVKDKPAPPEDPMRRRTLTGTAAGLAAGAALPRKTPTAVPRVGMSDADRLEAEFARLVAADNRFGGSVGVETRALAFAHHAMELQAVGYTTQRVRGRLYGLAAAFTSTALWAAVDDHAPDRAQQHLDRAMTLAGLSGSSEIHVRLWGHAAMLANQQRRPHDALAAAQAGRASSVCRRDPLYRSLTAARLAGTQAQTGQRSSALRSLGQAAEAFEQADHRAPRPAWMIFFDRSELDGLGAIALGRLGEHSQAEAYLHRTLSRLRPGYDRNRVYYGTLLALAQLRQGDVEQACTTAATVAAPDNAKARSGRTAILLNEFTRELSVTAPRSSAAAQWNETYTSRQGGPR
jgi:transcriptional regulator with XRE-family HTH domain